MNKYPKEIKGFIEKNYIGCGPSSMAKLINKTFGTDYTKSQLKSYYGNNKLNSGLTGRFEKGNVPANKGLKGYCHPDCKKTWFKKGHTPVNHKHIGSERIDRKDGYILVKVNEPNKWVLKHRLVWEEHNGSIPKGYVIIFKDGDKTNVSIDNLALISRAEHLELTRSHLRSSNPDLTETGINVAKIRTMLRGREANDK